MARFNPFKNLFGLNRLSGNEAGPLSRDNSRNKPITLTDRDLVDDVIDLDERDLVPDLPTPMSEADEEAAIQKMLEEQGIAADDAAFLAGEKRYVISSNVRSIQYHWTGAASGSDDGILLVEYVDGSLYEYEPVPFGLAEDLYRAGSYGKWVWDNLRVRGTVFGYQIPYRLVTGDRVWHAAGKDSIARHQAIPKSGEPFLGYHPSMNYKGAKGVMGQKNAGVNLGKKGSKKVGYWVTDKDLVD